MNIARCIHGNGPREIVTVARSIVARGPQLVAVIVIFGCDVIESVAGAGRVNGDIDVAGAIQGEGEAAILSVGCTVVPGGPKLVAAGIILDGDTAEIAVRHSNASDIRIAQVVHRNGPPFHPGVECAPKPVATRIVFHRANVAIAQMARHIHITHVIDSDGIGFLLIAGRTETRCPALAHDG